MKRGKKSVDDGIEVLMAPGRQIDQADTSIERFGMPFAAVHRNLVPARCQTSGKFFSKRLKPAIAGRNSAGAKNRDVRRRLPQVSYLTQVITINSDFRVRVHLCLSMAE